MQITVTAIKLTAIAVAISAIAGLIGFLFGYLVFESSTDTSTSNDAIALKNSEVKVKELETKLAAAESLVEQLKRQLDDVLEKKIPELTAQLSATTTERDTIQSQLTENENEIDRLNNIINSQKFIQDELKSKQTQLRNLEYENSRLIQEVDQLKKQLDDTTTQLKGLEEMKDKGDKNPLVRSSTTASSENIPVPEFYTFKNTSRRFMEFRSRYYNYFKNRVDLIFEDAANNDLTEKNISKEHIIEIILITTYWENIIRIEGIFWNKKPNSSLNVSIKSDLRQIEIIRIAHVNLNSISFRSFEFFKNLKRLEIMQCGLNDDMLKDGGFKETIDAGEAFSKLNSLDLSRNSLVEFPDVSKLEQLTKLFLCENSKLTLSGKPLSDYLHDNFKQDTKHCCYLDITKTSIRFEGIEDFRKSFGNNLCISN